MGLPGRSRQSKDCGGAKGGAGGAGDGGRNSSGAGGDRSRTPRGSPGKSSDVPKVRTPSKRKSLQEPSDDDEPQVPQTLRAPGHCQCLLCGEQCVPDGSNWRETTTDIRKRILAVGLLCFDCGEFQESGADDIDTFHAKCKDKKEKKLLLEDQAEWKENDNKHPGELEFEQADVWEDRIYESFFEERHGWQGKEDFKDQNGKAMDETYLKFTQAGVKDCRNEEQTGILLDDDGDDDDTERAAESGAPGNSGAPGSSAGPYRRKRRQDKNRQLVTRNGSRLVMRLPIFKSKNHRYRRQAQNFCDQKANQLGDLLGCKWNNRYKPKNAQIQTYTHAEIRERLQQQGAKHKGAPSGGLKAMTAAPAHPGAAAGKTLQLRGGSRAPLAIVNDGSRVAQLAIKHQTDQTASDGSGTQKSPRKLAICDRDVGEEADNASEITVSTRAPTDTVHGATRSKTPFDDIIDDFHKPVAEIPEPPMDVDERCEDSGSQHGSHDSNLDDDGLEVAVSKNKTKTLEDWMESLNTDRVWQGKSITTGAPCLPPVPQKICLSLVA